MSRSPIRDALDRLSDNYFVYREKGKGYFVSGFSEKEFRNATEISFELEPFAAKKAAPDVTDNDLNQIYKIGGKIREVYFAAAEEHSKLNYSKMIDYEYYHTMGVDPILNSVTPSRYGAVRPRMMR